jgi:hypothetical protein
MLPVFQISYCVLRRDSAVGCAAGQPSRTDQPKLLFNVSGMVMCDLPSDGLTERVRTGGHQSFCWPDLPPPRDLRRIGIFLLLCDLNRE